MGLAPMTSVKPVQCSTNWAVKSAESWPLPDLWQTFSNDSCWSVLPCGFSFWIIKCMFLGWLTSFLPFSSSRLQKRTSLVPQSADPLVHSQDVVYLWFWHHIPIWTAYVLMLLPEREFFGYIWAAVFLVLPDGDLPFVVVACWHLFLVFHQHEKHIGSGVSRAAKHLPGRVCQFTFISLQCK